VAEADPLIGRTLGEFEILELLGRGGMGAVYRARQPSLDRFVAIKILLPELAANPEFVQRFYREARTAAAVRHRHIVQVHAVGEVDGTHYIAMEYVDGEGLDAVLRREGRLAPDRALKALREVCTALAAAHDAGIVHRDIKPSNILVDSKGSVRVTDFGLARHAEGDAAATQTTAALGTPLYLAPEVASGAPASAQSDLYSLGATFYHLLAGRPPLEGTVPSELIVKHVTETPPSLRDVAPFVDRRLAILIDRLLSKKPSARPASARALLGELDGLDPLQAPGTADAGRASLHAELAQAPTATQPGGGLERQAARARLGAMRRRARTRRILIASGAAATLAVLLVLALGRQGRGTDRLPPPPPEDAAARSRAPGALLFSSIRQGIEALRAASQTPKAELAPSAQPRTPEEKLAAGEMEKGLVAAFYEGRNFERFVTARLVPQIGFNWGPAAPAPNVPADNFSIRFAGWLRIRETGDYTFRFWRDDGAKLYLDGYPVIDEWEACNNGRPQTVWLTEGLHRIWVEYMEMVGMAGIALLWRQAGGEAWVPADVFFSERERAERVRRDPTQDPLADLVPLGPGKLPAAAPAPVAAPLPGLPPEGLGPMAAKPVEPFEAAFRDDEWLNWQVEGDEWVFGRDSVVADSYHNGWLVLKDRRLDDFVFEADVTDLGKQRGFTFGLIFRRMAAWQMMLSLTTEFRAVQLRAISGFRPQAVESVPGVTLRGTEAQVVPRVGQRYHLKAECVGTRVRAWVDGALVGEGEDRTLLRGEVALYVHLANVRFENVRIRPAPEAPAEAPEALERLWWDRAERLGAAPKLSPRAKLRAWEEILERFPQAPAASLARVREQRDRWAKDTAATLGVFTERSKRYENTVFNTPLTELPDGRFRLLYTADRPREYRDWETLLGFAHVPNTQFFCMCDTRIPLSACDWNFDHGDDVKVSFYARARRAYGCTIFGLPGDPLGSGIALTVGAEGNRATTFGPAGQPPWFRSDVIAASQLLFHELDVKNGELVYRMDDKEVFRRKVDLTAFPGRRTILWSTARPEDRPNLWETPEFYRICIDSAPQADWVGNVHPGGPPPRECVRPDAQGWLGLAHPLESGDTQHAREHWHSHWGRATFEHLGPTKAPCSSNVNRQGTFRDAVLVAQGEFLGPETGRRDESFGLIFRCKDHTEYVASLFRTGGVALRQRTVSPDTQPPAYSSATLAEAKDVPPPQGPFRLVAVVDGPRAEIYCNGQLALSWQGLSEDAGQLGYENERATFLLHDFKFRPLPADPMYPKIYGAKAP